MGESMVVLGTACRPSGGDQAGRRSDPRSRCSPGVIAQGSLVRSRLLPWPDFVVLCELHRLRSRLRPNASVRRFERTIPQVCCCAEWTLTRAARGPEQEAKGANSLSAQETTTFAQISRKSAAPIILACIPRKDASVQSTAAYVCFPHPSLLIQGTPVAEYLSAALHVAPEACDELTVGAMEVNGSIRYRGGARAGRTFLISRPTRDRRSLAHVIEDHGANRLARDVARLAGAIGSRVCAGPPDVVALGA